MLKCNIIDWEIGGSWGFAFKDQTADLACTKLAMKLMETK